MVLQSNPLMYPCIHTSGYSERGPEHTRTVGSTQGSGGGYTVQRSNLRPEMSLPVGTVPTVRDIFSMECPYVPIHVPTGRDRLSGLRSRILQMRWAIAYVRGGRRYDHRTGMTESLRLTFEACATAAAGQNFDYVVVRVCFINAILSPYQQHGALTTLAACAAPCARRGRRQCRL